MTKYRRQTLQVTYFSGLHLTAGWNRKHEAGAGPLIAPRSTGEQAMLETRNREQPERLRGGVRRAEVHTRAHIRTRANLSFSFFISFSALHFARQWFLENISSKQRIFSSTIITDNNSSTNITDNIAGRLQYTGNVETYSGKYIFIYALFLTIY